MNEKRDKPVVTNLTKSEFKKLRKIAFENEMTISSFVRNLILKEITKKEKR